MTFPLVQMMQTGLTFERWREFVAEFCTDRANSMIGAGCDDILWQRPRGIIVIANERGYIHGLFSYQVRDDMSEGLVLHVDNIMAVEIVSRPYVLDAMRDAMNASSATLPHGADEFGHAGIEKANCDQINCARVATAPASLECRMTQMVKIEGENNFVVFGEVVGVHMRDDCIKDGRFDVTTYQPLSRLGYRDYARVTDVFEIIRPDD